MLFAYQIEGDKLARMAPEADLAAATWIDLYRPMPPQSAAVAALGIEVPSLDEMEEIEISARLYRNAGTEVMTVVVPGLSTSKAPMAGPVTFILAPERLVTVRHHAPRPFETFPARADRSGPGCSSPDRIFLGLIEEIIGRLADLMEGTGRALDDIARTVFGGQTDKNGAVLKEALVSIGREGELLGRVRLCLLTLERALSYFSQIAEGRPGTKALNPFIKGATRDIQALGVHADFLSARVSLATDATLGMISLAQNDTVRILSVIAALFLPPTLIASAYGMNFVNMPELAQPWGYPAALALMAGSAVVTWVILKWRRWI